MIAVTLAGAAVTRRLLRGHQTPRQLGDSRDAAFAEPGAEDVVMAMAGPNVVIQFFFAHPGDLSIPDVGWRGDLRAAQRWADMRLTTLQALSRPPAELCPLAARIVSQGEVVWLRIDNIAAATSAHGIWGGREVLADRGSRPENFRLGTKSMG